MVNINKRLGSTNALASADPSELLFSNVASSGSIAMNVDASGILGGSDFFYTCPANQTVHISRINFIILDASILLTDFGGIANGLPSGVLINVLDDDNTIILDFLDGESIQQNVDFGLLAGVDTQISTGTDGLFVRWSLFKTGANLKLTAGQSIRISIRDDLSSLEKFNAMIQGTVFNE